MGYVGLPLLHAFHKAGYPVIGFDVDGRKIDALHRGENYLKHLGGDMVSSMKSAGRFDATADMARLGDADVVIVCVPTPLGRHMEPDMTFIEKASDDIARTIRPGQLIVLESIFATTIIGTYFLMCIGHCETAGCSTAEEAIALWNAGKYEECDAPKDGGLQLDQGDWPVL